MTRTAEDRPDGRDVALAEHAVLREDDDPATDAAAEDALRGQHVLRALAAGAERVPIEPGHGVRRSGPADEQHPVLRGERRDLEATPDDVEPPMIL